jgi:hypothetical protein
MSEKHVLVPVQITGSIDAAAKKIDGLKSGEYKTIYIQNTHGSQTLYLSMDRGEHWLTITPTKHDISLDGSWDHPIDINEEDWQVKGSGSSTTFEIVLLQKALKKAEPEE